jgi:uncharacterized protein (TIGR02453 family)
MLAQHTLDFIQELTANNNRDWFHGQQKRYELVKADYKQLVTRLLVEMQQHDPSLASLTPKECTFRIARDIRFSKDKSPYKTNLGIGLSTYGKKSGMAEYYVHIQPGAAFVAGGIYQPEVPQLKKIRREIDVFSEDLEAVLGGSDFRRMYGALSREDALSRPPKGYSLDHPAIEHLKLKRFIAVAPLEDRWFTSPDFVPHLVQSLVVVKPLLDFINRGLRAEEEAEL